MLFQNKEEKLFYFLLRTELVRHYQVAFTWKCPAEDEILIFLKALT